MRGRKPTPTETKRRLGNPGRRPLPENEPTYPAADLKPPAWLARAAKTEWRRLAPALQARGLLTQADVASFAAYCQAYARYQKAEREIRRLGEIDSTPKGFKIVGVWLTVSNGALDRMLRIAGEFGFTPASRTRIHVESPQEGDDGILSRPCLKVVAGGKT